jgi:hypothetical protein
MSIEFTVVCNSCGGVISASAQSITKARREAVDQCGATSLPGGRDYCSENCEQRANSSKLAAPSAGVTAPAEKDGM